MEARFGENRERLVRGETIAQMRLPCVRKDGSAVDIWLAVAPVFDSTGKLRSLMGVMSEAGKDGQNVLPLHESDSGDLLPS